MFPVPFRHIKAPVKGDVKSLREFLEWEARGWRRFDVLYLNAVESYAEGEDPAGGFDHAGLTVLS